MPVDTAAIGKAYPPSVYAVGREKIVEYAHATGETDPLHLDFAAARRGGYADVVAPPMFTVVFQGRAVARALFDPEVGIDFAHMLHGSQEFRWGPVVVAGDEVSTTVTVESISERAGLGFFVFAAQSRNRRDEIVSRGTWTNIVREAQ